MKIADVKTDGTEYAHYPYGQRDNTLYSIIARLGGTERLNRVRVLEKIKGGLVRLEKWDEGSGQWSPMAPGFRGHPRAATLIDEWAEVEPIAREVEQHARAQRERAAAKFEQEQDILRRLDVLLRDMHRDDLPRELVSAMALANGIERSNHGPYNLPNRHASKVSVSVGMLLDMIMQADR